MAKEAFTGKVVVVTGGASGIGAAIARKFGSAGAKLALLDMDERQLERAKTQFIAEGVEVHTALCDVTSEAVCTAAIAEVVAHFGGIDMLVNNAGITQRSAFLDTELAVYRKVMAVNFFGTVHCTKAAIASLIERRGQIIVISSISGFAPILGRTGYCASKHALHGFYGVLRAELKPHGVHVMLVCPGFTQTNLQTRALDGDGSVTTHPQSRVGAEATPESVAAAVYRAAIKKKRMVVLSSVGKLTFVLTRIAPAFYERMMANKLRAELERDRD